MSSAGVLLAACLLAGCATQFDISGGDWTKAGAGIQQVTLDEMDCARAASRSYGTPDLIVGGLADAIRAKIEDAQMESAFSRCMESRGYQPTRSS